VVFFDYNGNGIRDEGEPPIPGAKVQVGSLTATTGPDGSYTLKGVPRGKQQVRLSAPGFRYISLSVEAFQLAERPVTVTVEGDTRRDWGLMQGFWTLPVQRGVRYSIGNFVDVGDVYDHTFMRDWEGGQKTYPGHQGIDFDIENKTVVSVAPGLIIGAESNYLPEIGIRVVIYHPGASDLGKCNIWLSEYNDLRALGPDIKPLSFDYEAFKKDPCGYIKRLGSENLQSIPRGYVIGYTGYLGPPLDVRVHVEAWTTDPRHTHGESVRIIDPYRDTSTDTCNKCAFSNRLFPLWVGGNQPSYP
jgi:hypothetical protein